MNTSCEHASTRSSCHLCFKTSKYNDISHVSATSTVLYLDDIACTVLDKNLGVSVTPSTGLQKPQIYITSLVDSGLWSWWTEAKPRVSRRLPIAYVAQLAARARHAPAPQKRDPRDWFYRRRVELSWNIPLQSNHTSLGGSLSTGPQNLFGSASRSDGNWTESAGHRRQRGTAASSCRDCCDRPRHAALQPKIPGGFQSGASIQLLVLSSKNLSHLD